MSDFFDPTNWQHWSVLALGVAFLQVGYWVSGVEGQTYRSTTIRLGHSHLGRPRRERSFGGWQSQSRRRRSFAWQSQSRRKQRATPMTQPRSGRVRPMASSVAPQGRSRRKLPSGIAPSRPPQQPHRAISMR